MTPVRLGMDVAAVMDALKAVAKRLGFGSVRIEALNLLPEGELRVVFKWKPPETP